MNQDNATSFINLPQLTLKEKREIFMSRTGLSLDSLASAVGVTSSTLSKNLRNPTIPTRQHKALVGAGMPEILLPEPYDVKPGPKRKVADDEYNSVPEGI